MLLNNKEKKANLDEPLDLIGHSMQNVTMTTRKVIPEMHHEGF